VPRRREPLDSGLISNPPDLPSEVRLEKLNAEEDEEELSVIRGELDEVPREPGRGELGALAGSLTGLVALSENLPRTGEGLSSTGTENFPDAVRALNPFLLKFGTTS